MKATARIEMRCEKREKELLNRAAAIKGMRTTAFIRELALEQARQVIDQAERIELGESSYQQVLDLLDNPPAPSDALRRAAQAHRSAGL
jgi:uncharacterized protein (DUF1778 family)